MTAPRGARTLLVVALLGCAYCAYSPALDGELQFDDVRSIADNPGIKDPGHFSRIGPGDLLGTGRLLTDLTFWLNYRASALSVRPYHLANLAAHFGVVLAVLALALVLLRRACWPAPFATAWIAAALFALHPLQSQAVAYVSQRAEVLAALFYLLGLLLLLAAEERRGVAAAPAIAGALLCVLLGWSAKPTLATFPAAYLLCSAAFPAPQATWRRRALASLPFWAMTIAFSARLLAGVRGTTHAGFGVPALGAGSYLLTESRVLLTYLRLLAWPAGQNADWQFAPSASALEPRTLLALLALAALALFAGWAWRWSARGEQRALARLAALGVGWFFLVLAPTSSVVPVADVIAEHRVYLASFGVFLPAAAAGVAGVRTIAEGPRRAAAGAAAGLVLCAALAAALYRRAAVWASSASLWSDVVAKSPDKARGHNNLGYALTPADPARALHEFQIARRIDDGTVPREELMQNVAGALLALRRFPEAISILEELNAGARASPQLGTNIAIAYLESGRLDAAQSAAEQAAARWPSYAPARHTLGQIAFVRGDYSAAEREFAQAVALDRDSAASLASLAATQERRGERASACRSWAEVATRAAGPMAEAALQRLAALECRP